MARLPAPYIAQPGATKPSEMSVTPMVGYSGANGVEAGGKVDYLIANAAFIPKLNNSVFIEGEAFFASNGGPFVAPGLRWEFHLHPMWTVYGEGGIEANLNPGRHEPGATLVIAAGAIWHIPAKGYAVRGEVNSGHGALRAGPQFGF